MKDLSQNVRKILDTTGGTLGVSIYPYVYRVVANRWNNNSQLQEFLYDQDYVGYFYDSFGGDVFVEPGDGAELDIYAFPSYTGDLGLTKTAPITTLKQKSNVVRHSSPQVVGTGRILERQGQFDPAGVAENKQSSDIPRKRAGKITDHDRTRNQIRNRQHAQ